MVGRAHRLLGHLALVHVTRRLVVVTEWNGRSYDRQDVQAVKLLMSGVRPDIFLQCSYGKCNLLEWSNPLNSTNDEILYRSDKASDLARHEDSWEVVVFLCYQFIVLWIAGLCSGACSRTWG